MLSFDDALGRVLDAAPRLDSERVPLREAFSRTLAETLITERPLPAYDYSAMDGYAVLSRYFIGDGPWTLPVIGESRAGHPATSLEPQSCMRVFTGARIPEGADAVVLQEDVQRTGVSVRFTERPLAGDHIRRAGDDLSAGAVALTAGMRLNAYRLGLAAALDRSELVVCRKPRVRILSTGDELRTPGSTGAAETVPECNGVAIAALAQSAGADAEVLPSTGDHLGGTTKAIQQALRSSDVLVTVGGVSVGTHDIVKPALEAAGVVLDFWKVAIKPGKPLVLGRAGDTVVLGLPGNPVSAQLTFSLFGLPLLRKMQGEKQPLPSAMRLPLAQAIRQKPGRRGFYRAVIEGTTVTALSSQASGATTSLAWANALIVVPEDSPGYEAGDLVTVYRLDDL